MELKLYKQQEEALEAMMRFVTGPKSVFILKGYAGTGKTTVIKALCHSLTGLGRSVELLAPTGRAAKVLRDKTGHGAATIHKAIYSRQAMKLSLHDDKGKDKEEHKVVYEECHKEDTSHAAAESEKDSGIDKVEFYFEVKKITDNGTFHKPVIIIDEASLISSKKSSQELIHFGTDVLIHDLLTYAQLTLGTKIVFVGDPAQLPPVGDNLSCALSEDYFAGRDIAAESFVLTEVVRQSAESVVLANAMKIRNLLNSPIRNELCLALRKGEMEELSPSEAVTKFTEICPTPEFGQSIVICFSNAQANAYNRAIRQKYFPNEELHKGDILQVVRNSYFIKNAPEEALSNGDFIRIISEPGPVEIREIPLWADRKGKRERIHLELSFQDVEFETESGGTGSAKILTTLLNNDRPGLTREENVALYVDFKIRNPQLKEHTESFFNAMLTDSYINALQAKYGYATTCHKAQGGEWDTVIADYSGRTGLDDNSLKWSYTATTRAAKSLYGINIPHVTPFQKFSISNIKAASKPSAEVICVKDSICDLLPQSAIPAQKAKCNSAKAALSEMGYRLQEVECKPYRDRYIIETPNGQQAFDCQFNAAGIFTKYSSLRPSPDDAAILRALHDERCYEYERDYSPSMKCLEDLRNLVTSAADEYGITITGIKEFPERYYVLYGLHTSASFATLQFYFNGKDFITRSMAASALGGEDELLQKMINRIQEMTCQQ